MKNSIPAQCPKSASPYNFCPFVFRHEDGMILEYISTLASEIKRVNGLSMVCSGEEARLIDRYAGQVTAYLNGRIHQIVFGKQEMATSKDYEEQISKKPEGPPNVII